MSDVVIKSQGIGKKYIISHETHGNYKALRDVIGEKTKQLFNTQKKRSKEEFWALKDIGFEIRRGEAVGIIGRNGAGKSTLLKILSRITEPTTGRVEINGLTSSLLEVGTGFHPELTGRENVFLNGAILGMSRQEIKKKFDSIVEFSGVEKFLDTPVKRYSSGMYLRLAFSVAAYLEPEILIVDEVLAVGDAEFQKKCLGKMDEVTKNEGRTVLFVSHNLAAIRQLCKRVLYLDKGAIEFDGDTHKGLSIYAESIRTSAPGRETAIGGRRFDNKKAFISGFDVKMANENKNILISIFVEATEAIKNMEVAVGINDPDGNRIVTFHCRFNEQQFELSQGRNEFICSPNNFFLKPGPYTMNIFLGNKYETLDYVDDPVPFDVNEYAFYHAGEVPDHTQGALMADHTWTLKTRNND